MNKVEFLKEFKELCEYYNNKIYENKKVLKFYYDKVKIMDLERFKKKNEELISNSKFMPKVADFNASSGFLNYEQRIYSKEFLETFYDNL